VNSEEINVGDFVEVVNEGRNYDYYKDWATKYQLKSFLKGNPAHIGTKCKVVVKAPHGTYSDTLLGIEDTSGKQFIIGIEGVKKINKPFTLPEKFIMKSEDTSWLTTLVGDAYYCEATISKFHSGPYTEERLTKIIKECGYTIEPIEEANGVDGEGKPFNFTKEMLRPFMRVKTKNGSMWAVIPNVQDNVDDTLVLSSGNGWECFGTDFEEDYEKPYEAIEVYECPTSNYEMVDISKVGELIWKAYATGGVISEGFAEEIPNVENNVLQESNFEQRLKHIEDTLAAVNSKIANLQRNNTLFR